MIQLLDQIGRPSLRWSATSLNQRTTERYFESRYRRCANTNGCARNTFAARRRCVTFLANARKRFEFLSPNHDGSCTNLAVVFSACLPPVDGAGGSLPHVESHLWRHGKNRCGTGQTLGSDTQVLARAAVATCSAPTVLDSRPDF